MLVEKERSIEFGLLTCGLVSILITLLIAWFIVEGSYHFFKDPNVSIWYFFTGTEWTGLFENPKFGILPLFTGV